MELSLLTAKLPEGWNLPSYLSAIVQVVEITGKKPINIHSFLLKAHGFNWMGLGAQKNLW